MTRNRRERELGRELGRTVRSEAIAFRRGRKLALKLLDEANELIDFIRSFSTSIDKRPDVDDTKLDKIHSRVARVRLRLRNIMEEYSSDYWRSKFGTENLEQLEILEEQLRACKTSCGKLQGFLQEGESDNDLVDGETADLARLMRESCRHRVYANNDE